MVQPPTNLWWLMMVLAAVEVSLSTLSMGNYYTFVIITQSLFFRWCVSNDHWCFFSIIPKRIWGLSKFSFHSITNANSSHSGVVPALQGLSCLTPPSLWMLVPGGGVDKYQRCGSSLTTPIRIDFMLNSISSQSHDSKLIQLLIPCPKTNM